MNTKEKLKVMLDLGTNDYVNGSFKWFGEVMIEPSLIDGFNKLDEVTQKHIVNVSKDAEDFGYKLIKYFRSHLLNPESIYIFNFENKMKTPSYKDEEPVDIVKSYEDIDISVNKSLRNQLKDFDIILDLTNGELRGFTPEEAHLFYGVTAFCVSDGLQVTWTKCLINGHKYSIACEHGDGGFNAFFFKSSEMVQEELPEMLKPQSGDGSETDPQKFVQHLAEAIPDE